MPVARAVRVPPPLCVASEAAPSGEDWLHEIKWDGFRMLAEVSDGRACLRLRDGQDWTARFPELVRALEAIGPRDALLDGEVVALDRHGRSDYDALKRALRSGRTAALRYIAFDLPALAGVDLARAPLIERKRLLEGLLAAQASAMLVYGKHIVGHGERVFAASRRQGVEGIVSKRVDSPYQAGRSGDWLKLRHEAGREFIVVGYTPAKGSGQRHAAGPVAFDSLLVARPEGVGLRYAGRVSAGLDPAVMRELSARLAALASAAPLAMEDAPARARWVKPCLVVELVDRGRDRTGRLRQFELIRLREDKSADELDPEVRPTAAQQ
jgi:bifunctional non-homologous end joining protein LigD